MYTCVAWVKQGVAKETPDKVQLTEEELRELIEDAKEKIEEHEGTNDATESNGFRVKKEILTDEEDEEDDPIALYALDDYDDDDEDQNSKNPDITKLTVFATPEEDPYITLKNPDDLEKDEFQINPTDNLIVTGKLEEDFSCAEVHVYNEEEGNFYVHHDIILESYPLVMEWLSFDSLEDTDKGNLVAIGTMEPQIQIWDLDIIDIVNPQIVLGKGRKKKKKKNATSAENTGHQDAVLALSWNRNLKSALASGSADTTVVLWDLEHTKGVYTLKHHREKVQGLHWHPYDTQSLLSCSSDKSVFVVDCREPESNSRSWRFESEIEQCLWNPLSPYHFVTGSSSGDLNYCDVRKDSPIYNISAHTKSIEGLAFSSQIPGCLVTVSADKSLKVWDIAPESPKFVMARPMNMGRLHGVSACPDHGYTFAVVGEKKSPNIFNIMETSEAGEYFSCRQPVYTVTASNAKGKKNERSFKADEEGTNTRKEEEVTAMECETTASALASLEISSQNIASSNTMGIGQRIKKKKKKKK